MIHLIALGFQIKRLENSLTGDRTDTIADRNRTSHRRSIFHNKLYIGKNLRDRKTILVKRTFIRQNTSFTIQRHTNRTLRSIDIDVDVIKTAITRNIPAKRVCFRTSSDNSRFILIEKAGLQQIHHIILTGNCSSRGREREQGDTKKES